jgi:hypothetical protein
MYKNRFISDCYSIFKSTIYNEETTISLEVEGGVEKGSRRRVLVGNQISGVNEGSVFLKRDRKVGKGEREVARRMK